MRSPCHDCEYLHRDKSSMRCMQCTPRIEYVRTFRGYQPTPSKETVKVKNIDHQPGLMEKKECRRCGELLPLTAFSSNAKCQQGREGTCKVCKKKRMIENATDLSAMRKGEQKLRDAVGYPPPEPAERGPKELTGKPDWSIFPFREAEPVVKVFEYGVKKYGAPFTYRKGIPTNELLAAIFRHAIAIQNGELVDLESECLHAGHIAANSLMMLSNERG